MQREMDFSESNLWNRWFGVNSFWKEIQGETKRFVKVRLERALVVEQGRRVGCGRYRRSQRRRGYRNGSYERDLLTSYGWIEGLKVPRVREGGIESEVLERYRRRQRAVDRVLLEAFLLGHSTRKSIRWFKSLFGKGVSAQAVSNIVKELDQQVQHYHRRRLGDDYRFLYLDGLWITLSKPVKVKKVLLVALGVKADGKKELLSFQLAGSESECEADRLPLPLGVHLLKGEDQGLRAFSSTAHRRESLIEVMGELETGKGQAHVLTLGQSDAHVFHEVLHEETGFQILLQYPGQQVAQTPGRCRPTSSVKKPLFAPTAPPIEPFAPAIGSPHPK